MWHGSIRATSFHINVIPNRFAVRRTGEEPYVTLNHPCRRRERRDRPCWRILCAAISGRARLQPCRL